MKVIVPTLAAFVLGAALVPATATVRGTQEDDEGVTRMLRERELQDLSMAMMLEEESEANGETEATKEGAPHPHPPVGHMYGPPPRPKRNPNVQVGFWVHAGPTHICPGSCLGFVMDDKELQRVHCDEPNTLWENVLVGQSLFMIRLFDRKLVGYTKGGWCVPSRQSISDNSCTTNTFPFGLVPCDSDDAGLFGRFGTEVRLYDASCWLHTGNLIWLVSGPSGGGCGLPPDAPIGYNQNPGTPLNDDWTFIDVGPKAFHYIGGSH